MSIKRNRVVDPAPTTPPAPTNGLIPADPPRPPPSYGRLIVAPGTPADQWPTTLDDSPAHLIVRLNAVNSPDLELDEGGQADFWLRHCLAHPVEHVDPDTGELRQVSRLVLITPDGQTFATTSTVVPHRVQAILDLVRAGRLELPVRVRIRARRSKKSGRIYHELVVLAVEGM